MLKKLVFRLILVFILVFLVAGHVTNSTFTSGDTWLTGWTYRIQLTIDHTKVSAALSDFPIMVHISASSGIGSSDVSSVFDELTSNANRKKIAVTTSDGATQCYVEISYWSDSDEQAFLWVKVPSISSTTDTVLYLYYDHSQSDNTAYVGDVNSTPGEAVWSNFVAVYHLTESGDGTTGEYKDSTGNHLNGTGGGGIASKTPIRTINEFGLPVQSFDGIDDYIRFPDDDAYSIPTPGIFVNTYDISLSDLEQTTAPSGYRAFMGKVRGAGEAAWMEWFWGIFNESHETRSNMFNWYVGSPGSTYQATANIRKVDPLIVNQWYNNAVICTTTSITSGVMYAYQDGLHHGEESIFTDYSVDYQNGPAPLCIGNYVDGYTYGSLNGRISEVRFSNVSTSVGWFKASSESEKDNLLSFEVQTSQSPALTTNAASGITTSGATLNANLISQGTVSNVTVSFEYGLATSYGSTVAGIPPIMTSTGAFSANLTALTPNTLYHYRSKVVGNGTAYGNDRTFTTFSTNQPPVLAPIGNKSSSIGVSLQFTLSATDPEGGTLTYTASNLPAGSGFTPATRTFTWTPGIGQAGTYANVQFSVSDNGSLTDSENITITVNNVNQAPVLTNPGNRSVNEGAPLTFTLSATDSDNDMLTFSSLNLPTGANLNSTTGVFSWTPSYNQAGTYANVQFIVSDGQLTDSENITITVNGVNRAPVLGAIGNKSVNEGQLLTFTLSATDPEGGPLTYTASNLPAGSSFTPATRTFIWTPASSQVGSYADVHFEVTDGGITASENIMITVNASTPPSPLPPSGNTGGSSGGGGGGSVGITSLMNSMTLEGVVVEDVHATDINSKIELRIPKGIIVKNRMGQNVSYVRISIKESNSAVDSGSRIIGPVYEIEQTGTTFTPSAALIFKYSESEMPQDILADNLYIALWDTDTMTWTDLGGVIDAMARTIIAPITHLSTYALMAHTRPANISMSNFILTSAEVIPGETVTARVVVHNQGDFPGSFTVNLKLDDTLVDTRSVTLNGSGSETIVFTLTSDMVGEHKATIGDMVATFVVKQTPSLVAFTVTELSINPLIANSGENVEVNAIIKNLGDLAGTYRAILYVDDAAVETKEVMIEGGGNTTVSFSFTADTVGQHKLSIGGLLVPFEVKTAPQLFPPPVNTTISTLEINSFRTTPSYDVNAKILAFVRIEYDMNQSWESFPDARLMMTVFHNNQFLEQVSLLTLNELQADGQTGELNYVPAAGWETGDYAFRAELYQGETLIQDTSLQHLTATSESTPAVVSWKTLGIIIGSVLVLGVLILTIVLYYQRNTLRDYWK